MKLGIDWVGLGGCAVGLAKLAFVLFMLALALDSSNSDGTRIVAAIFMVGLGIDARLGSLVRHHEFATGMYRQAEEDRRQLLAHSSGISSSLREIGEAKKNTSTTI